MSAKGGEKKAKEQKLSAEMGAANGKESASSENISQDPFLCCADCSSRLISVTASTKAAESSKTWTEKELTKTASRQVELNIS
jgi:hypothetical protein